MLNNNNNSNNNKAASICCMPQVSILFSLSLSLSCWCSDGLLLFHQLFLRGLHSRVEQWPVVKLGEGPPPPPLPHSVISLSYRSVQPFNKTLGLSVDPGDVLRLFIPMLAVYYHYIGNQTHALDVSYIWFISIVGCILWVWQTKMMYIGSNQTQGCVTMYTNK